MTFGLHWGMRGVYRDRKTRVEFSFVPGSLAMVVESAPYAAHLSMPSPHQKLQGIPLSSGFPGPTAPPNAGNF